MTQETAALLLAAGLSRRMGQQKLLLPLGDRPVIVRCIDTIRRAGIDNVVVVTGPEGGAVRNAIVNLPVTVVTNTDRESDMAGSVRAGLNAIGEAADSVFVCLGDHPLVSPATFAAMQGIYRAAAPGIVVPRYLGRKGHPVLFPRPLLERIREVPTLRDILIAHHGTLRLLDLYDEGVVIDMDTPQDYREVRLRFSAADAAARRMTGIIHAAGTAGAGAAGVPR